MKQYVNYCYTIISLSLLLIISSCSFIIPDNNRVKNPLVPINKNKQMQDDMEWKRADIPVQLHNISDDKKGSQPPVADFTIDPDNNHYIGINIFFNADTSFDPDGDSLDYYWDFGDGSPVFGPTHHNPVCHTYLIKGEYHIRLTIFDNNGNSSFKKKIRK